MLTSAHDRSCKSCGQERVLTDSFPAFAKKVLQALEGVPKTDELKFAQDRNICFNGVLMNKAMLIAAHLFTEDKINEQAAATLLQIERAHGREVLTSSYTKIVRVVQICTKEAEGFSLPVHMLINFFLSYLSWALCYDVLSPKAITLETLDKGGAKDGNSGLVQTSLAKLALVTHLQLLVQDHKLANPKSTVVDELERLFKNFRDYESYASCFRRTRTLAATQGQAKGKGEHQDQKAVPQGQDEEEKAAAPKLALDTDEIIETMKRTLSKVGTACLDFLYDVFAGVHDGALKALATSAGGASAIKFADSGTSDFGTCLHELVRLIGSHKQVVSVDTEAPPPPASRALRRWASEECQEAGRSAELSRERENVWKQVQQIRRKVANVAVCAFSSEDELQRFFQKCGSAASFVGKPAEAHRLFVWSGELFAEAAATPWEKGPVCSEHMRAALAFIVAQQGPSDTHLVCDGRSRTVRKQMEALMEQDRHISEIWAVYRPTERLGRGLSFASDNRETMLLSSCVERSALRPKERGAFTGAGESSTHASSYTNIGPVPWAALPQVTPEDKMRIVGGAADAPAAPPNNIYDSSCGVPLFWSERKPVAFWKQLIHDVDAKYVVDLSPGSGSLARATMASGVQYYGIVRSPEHLSWLNNVLDRYALELCAQTKSPLFEQDLATSVADHFQEVLDQLKEAAEMEDTVPEDDEEDEAL